MASSGCCVTLCQSVLRQDVSAMDALMLAGPKRCCCTRHFERLGLARTNWHGPAERIAASGVRLEGRQR